MTYQIESHVAQKLQKFFQKFDFIDKVEVFGSRARHDANPKSDIDLCIYSLEVTPKEFTKLKIELDELPILYKIDIVHFEKSNDELKKNIVKDGKLFFIRKKSLKQIATYINGKAFKPSEWAKDGLPIIRIQNLNDETKEYNYYNKEIDKKYIIESGDILISWSASLDIFEWKREKAVLNQHIFKVVFDKETEVDKKYFIFAIKQTLHNILKFVHGSTMKHIVKKDFENIEIPLPSLTKQKEIAKTLDKAQELIELRRESIKKLDVLSKSIFIDIFGDPVSNPKKFPKLKLNQIADIQTGNTPPRKDIDNYGNYIEWIKSDNILKDKYYMSKAKEYLSEKGYSKGRIVPSNSLLVTCIAGSMASIGNVNITDREVAFNQQINSITPCKDNVYYLYYSIKLSKKYIEENSSKSMKIMINKTKFGSLEFPIPDITLQDDFSKKIKKIEQQKALYEEQLRKLQENFDALLAQSFKA